MISSRVWHLARHLLFLFATIILLFFYPCVMFGFWRGIMIGLLTWSLYILCFPATHGNYIIGSWLRFVGMKSVRTEPYMLMFAVLINLVSLVLFQYLYVSTFFTRLLWRIITKPNPYWLMIAISLIGTLYYYLVDLPAGTVHRYQRHHVIIRNLLVLVGIISFFFFIWNDLVMLINNLV